MRGAAFLPLLCACASSNGPREPVDQQPVSHKMPEATLAEPWRSEVPVVPDRIAQEATPIRTKKLESGLIVVAVEQKRSKLVQISLVSRVGSAMDGLRRDGLTALSLDLLLPSQPKKQRIAHGQTLTRIGASIGMYIAQDHLFMGVNGLAEHATEMTKLLGEITEPGDFGPTMFERWRSAALDEVWERERSTSGIARQYLPRMIFGSSHPYGHSIIGTQDTLARLTPKAVHEQLDRIFCTGQTVLVGSGGISLDALVSLAENQLSKLPKCKTKERSVPEAMAPKRRYVTILHQPGMTQTRIVLGRNVPGATSVEAGTLLVVNELLGGSMVSRLQRELRERRGLTYGASSEIVLMRGAGSLVIESRVEASQTEAAIRAIWSVLGQMQKVPPSEEELEAARRRLEATRLRNRFDSIEAATNAIIERFAKGLPIETSATRQELALLEAGDVHEIAKRFLKTPYLQLMLVGDAKKLQPLVKTLGLGRPLLPVR